MKIQNQTRSTDNFYLWLEACFQGMISKAEFFLLSLGFTEVHALILPRLFTNIVWESCIYLFMHAPHGDQSLSHHDEKRHLR
jgi:hypothetical protein